MLPNICLCNLYQGEGVQCYHNRFRLASKTIKGKTHDNQQLTPFACIVRLSDMCVISTQNIKTATRPCIKCVKVAFVAKVHLLSLITNTPSSSFTCT